MNLLELKLRWTLRSIYGATLPIEPTGIEMKLMDSRLINLTNLPIEPTGIEITDDRMEHNFGNGLPIEPTGIEMSQRLQGYP